MIQHFGKCNSQNWNLIARKDRVNFLDVFPDHNKTIQTLYKKDKYNYKQ